MGAGLLVGSLESCNPVYMTISSENKINVPLSLFDKKDLQIIRAKPLEYDFALRKEKTGKFTALLLRCTHADNPLMSTGKEFVCDLHGSRFNIEGGVTQGPAEESLKKYSTEVISDSIIITLS